MVLYLQNAAVPPHWAQLVESSARIEVYTEHQVDTWQSLLELAVDPCDFSSDSSQVLDQEVPSTDTPITMESPYDAASATRVNQAESPHDAIIATRVNQAESPRNATIAAQVNRITFSEKQDNEIQSGSPVECNSWPTEWQMPDKINLDSSGLRCSAHSAVLSWQDKVYSHFTMVLKRVTQSSKYACLVLFSSFCAIGAVLNGGAQSHQVLVQNSSFFSNAIDSYDRINSLYDGTINCFSTLVQASLASNETFDYKEALQQSDKIEFIKAMVHEVEDHEKC